MKRLQALLFVCLLSFGGAALGCTAEKGACKTNSDCCSSTCNSFAGQVGTCIPKSTAPPPKAPVAPKYNGESCSAASECRSKNCHKGKCAN